MLSVVLRVNDGHATKSRSGRSWFSIAREAWATDILREHSFLWLVGSRLLFLMGAAMLVILGPFYLHQTFGLDEAASGTTFLVVVGFVLVANLAAVIPAGRLSDRIGRKRVLYLSFTLGALGMAVVSLAPILPVAYLGVVLFGLASGTFLAVDWALMTEIIPKASSGRYMGHQQRRHGLGQHLRAGPGRDADGRRRPGGRPGRRGRGPPTAWPWCSS